jgi:hypothetical protein
LLLLAVLEGAGCSMPAVLPEERVAIRPRKGDDDSALVVIHPATVCGLTIRDESGTLVDRDTTWGDAAPVDMTRRVPDAAWEVPDGRAIATVFTALAVPPGRYTLVGQVWSDDWEVLPRRSGDGARLARTNCDGALHRQKLRLPFRIEAGQVTLLAVPEGTVGFDELRALGAAADDPFVVLAARSWFPDVRQARNATRAALAARQRQPRDGYDVYPSCDGVTAVVRTTGTPVPWDGSLEHDARERRVRLPILTESLNATGYGRGCVRRFALVLLITDENAHDAAVNAAGAWLAAKNYAGEIDVLVTEFPEVR